MYVTDFIAYGLSFTGINTDFVPALPVALMKPFSGSGARGLMLEVFANPLYGPDSFVGNTASILQGSADTTHIGEPEVPDTWVLKVLIERVDQQVRVARIENKVIDIVEDGLPTLLEGRHKPVESIGVFRPHDDEDIGNVWQPLEARKLVGEEP
jgi:hypothetical protein